MFNSLSSVHMTEYVLPSQQHYYVGCIFMGVDKIKLGMLEGVISNSQSMDRSAV